MESIIRFSLKQKIFFNLLFVVLTVAGFFSMFVMPTERFPNVNFGEVTITTHFPGASPTEVESLMDLRINIIKEENLLVYMSLDLGILAGIQIPINS